MKTLNDVITPSHHCTKCGAMWRFWPERDTDQGGDSWSLVSAGCGSCCDNVYMGEQIIPVTLEEVRRFIVAAFPDY